MRGVRAEQLAGRRLIIDLSPRQRSAPPIDAPAQLHGRLDHAIVLVLVADCEAEVRGEAAGKATRPRSRSPSVRGPAARDPRARVRDGRVDGPAPPRGARPRGAPARRHVSDVGAGNDRLRREKRPRRRPRRSTPSPAADTWRCPRSKLRPRDREPDPQACQRVRLAHRPSDDEPLVSVPAAASSDDAGELDVGLVEHDDRGVTAVGRGIGREAVEERLDPPAGFGLPGRIVGVAEPDEVGARPGSRRAEPPRCQRSANPESGPRRGTRPDARRAAR